MSRLLQFSLRRLMGAVTVVCIFTWSATIFADQRVSTLKLFIAAVAPSVALSLMTYGHLPRRIPLGRHQPGAATRDSP